MTDDLKQAYRPEILLHPQIPKPLHGIAPRIILGKEWWDIKRQEAYQKYNHHCWACGVDKRDAKYHYWLEGHECYNFDYKIGELKLIEISALCHSCHNYIHKGRLLMIWQKGEIDDKKYYDILSHGEKILKECQTKKYPFMNDISFAHNLLWSEWYFLIEGKKYYSKFKDYQEWLYFYSEGKTK